MYQLPVVGGALVTSFDLSRSNQMLAFGDTCGECFLHVLCQANEANVLFGTGKFFHPN